MAHEPLLEKVREEHSFERKLRKHLGKRAWAKARSLEMHMRPHLSLDHLVRERYPTFQDALRDLDDALSMAALFATLPQTGGGGGGGGGGESKGPLAEHQAQTAAACAKLLRDWEAYVMKTGALKKSFISIKGIYFQAQVLGETITWVVPHQFTTAVPTDVDFRVMLTFLEFYQTFLGFVNFKLFGRLGWEYPGDPKSPAQVCPVLLKDLLPAVADENDLDAAAGSQPIFEGMVFYLSREVPRQPLALVIQSLGGKIGGWGTSDGFSPLGEDDPAITHQIFDRPVLNRLIAGRSYVQPQWVFDCLNQGQVIDCEGYGVGKALPPHLSPFVSKDDEEEVEAEVEVEKESENEAASEKKEETVKPKKASKKSAKVVKISDDAERKQLAISMMSKKHQKLYKQMQHGRKRKEDAKEALAAKRQSIAAKGKST